MAEATPEVPLALSPTWYGKVWLGASVHTSPAFAETYSEKFCVVPESSSGARRDVRVRQLRVLVEGGDLRVVPLVILPEKMPAMVFASRVRSLTPSTLYAIAIGEM